VKKAVLVADYVLGGAIGVDLFLVLSFVLQRIAIEVSRSDRRLRPEYYDIGRNGLFAVFPDEAEASAAFALRMIERFEAFDWGSIGAAKAEFGIHAALDVGMLEQCHTAPLGPLIYYGINVTLAHLVMPHAERGTVLTTEPFAAHLNAGAKHEFAARPVGYYRLYSGSGDEYPLYKVVCREQARYRFLRTDTDR
jgi:hypothetical protein